MLMSQPKKTPRYRKLHAGSVLEIQLAKDCFAYICVAKNSFYWLFDFVADRPLTNAHLLTTTRWKLPFLLWDYPPKAWRLVTNIELTSDEARIPPMWAKIDSDAMHYDVPTFYQVFSPETGGEYAPYFYITEEQSKTHHPNRVTDSNEIAHFIEEFLPTLELISVPESPTGSKPLPEVKLPPEEPEHPLLEVQFPCDMEDLGMEEWEISDAFDEALNDRELGLATSVDSGFSPCADDGQTGFSAEFCVVLDIEPGRLKPALTRIRRVLKKLKAPPATRIVEMTDDGNIVHPFIIK